MAPKAQTDAETTKVIGKHTRDRSGDTPDAQRARKDNDATMPDVPSLPTGSSGSGTVPGAVRSQGNANPTLSGLP